MNTYAVNYIGDCADSKYPCDLAGSPHGHTYVAVMVASNAAAIEEALEHHPGVAIEGVVNVGRAMTAPNGNSAMLRALNDIEDRSGIHYRFMPDLVLEIAERLRGHGYEITPRRSTSRDSEGTERRVQVYDGEGDLVLDVLVLNSMEADWLREFLEGTEAGDVYVDPVPPLRLAQSTSPIRR